MRNVTLAYAVYQLVSVGFEIWLLDSTESGTSFLIIRTLVGWVSGVSASLRWRSTQITPCARFRVFPGS